MLRLTQTSALVVLAGAVFKKWKIGSKEKECAMDSNLEEEEFYQLARLALNEREASAITSMNGEATEDDEDYYWEPLAIDTHSITRLTLGYGGPNDYLDVEHDGMDIIRITYRYFHWWEKASFDIAEVSALWQYCRHIIEQLEG